MRGLWMVLCAWAAQGAVPADVALYQHLQRLETYQGVFHQTQHGVQGEAVHSQGLLMWMRPDRVRWEVQTPEAQVWSTDGQQVWHYDPLLRQVTVQDPQSAGLDQSPVGLLGGRLDRLQSDYDVSYVSKQPGCYRLTPRAPHEVLKHVTLCFQADQLSQLVIADHMGQRTHMTLQATSSAPPLEPSMFRFEVPSGVTVVRPPSYDEVK